jgi:HK97 family phage major capsid protein
MHDPIMSLRRLNMSADAGERCVDFFEYCRALCRTKGDLALAARQVEGKGSQRLQAVIRSAVAAGTSSAANWAEPISQFSQMSNAFIQSLIGLSAFDTLMNGGMRRVPLKTKLAVTTTAAVASNIVESQIKPISSMTFDTASVGVQKSVVIVVATDELLRFSTPATETIFATELRAAVARSVDAVFLSSLYSGVSPTHSSGTTPTAMIADLRSLLDAIAPLASSRMFFVCSPASARALTLARDSGGPTFPGMRIDGGEVLPGVGCIVSDQLPTSSDSPSDTTALMIDATGLVGGDGGDISLDVARHASLQFQNAPDSPETAATVAESLWMHNKVGLRAERLFGFDVGRTGSVAALSGVAW